MRPVLLVGLAGVLVLGTAAAALGARADGGAGAVAGAAQDASPAYDGRFAFVRVRFGAGAADLRSGLGRWGRGREAFWAHDAPRAETNFLRILQELTSVPTDPDSRRVLDLDDPELFRYPVAYIVEVGYWIPSDAEAQALRSWLLKGGFLIVDDFRGDHILNFQAQMRRVLPGARMVPLEAGEEIFDSFFHIEDPYALMPPYERGLPPVYLGIFEENDPTRRLMAIVNYNTDLAEYWEFSDHGYYPIDLSNEAYKFGVNYVMYGLTH